MCLYMCTTSPDIREHPIAFVSHDASVIIALIMVRVLICPFECVRVRVCVHPLEDTHEHSCVT